MMSVIAKGLAFFLFSVCLENVPVLSVLCFSIIFSRKTNTEFGPVISPMRPGWRHVLALGLGRSGGKTGAAFRQGLDPSPFINSLSEATSYRDRGVYLQHCGPFTGQAVQVVLDLMIYQSHIPLPLGSHLSISGYAHET